MKLIHRIFGNFENDIVEKFLSVGISPASGFWAFEIADTDPRWPSVSKLVTEVGFSDSISTEFSLEERRQAKYLAIGPTWHHGYPQPDEENFGYRSATFDVSDGCESCGIGYVQNAPFRLSKKPKWGNKSLFQLNWVFDEYFVIPEVWETIFKPFGIGYRPVVLNKTGEVLDTVVQLEIPRVVDFDFTGRSYTTCEVCGRTKYDQLKIGFYPPPIGFEGVACKSTQYVGSGGRAFKLVVVSQALYRTIADAKLKGMYFEPCAQ